MNKLFFAFLVALLLAIPAPAVAQATAPEGFEIESHSAISRGVDHWVLVRESPPLVVNVARVSAGAPVALRAVLSQGRVRGPSTERTSSMCVRVNCILATNADFWLLESGEPLGGVVSSGELRRSPNDSHHQLVLDPEGAFRAVSLKWTGTVVTTDLRRMELHGVNRPRGRDQIVMYTTDYGPRTGTNEYGVEVLAEVQQPPAPVLLGQTARIRFVELREGAGNRDIPLGNVVLSGHGMGAATLRAAWQAMEAGDLGRQVLLRLETDPPALESVGGTPILVREGEPWFSDRPDGFVRGRHPRTLVGWTPGGDLLLVTIDGRQPGYSVGMSLAEAADFMIALGAREAINLDGGGSTTFVARSKVANRPSDRAVVRAGRERVVSVPLAGDRVLGNVERPVAVALALVALPGSGATVHIDPLEDGAFELPRTVAAPAPLGSDPGSNPEGGLPALVIEETRANRTLIFLALALNGGAALAVAYSVAVLLRRRTAPTP